MTQDDRDLLNLVALGCRCTATENPCFNCRVVELIRRLAAIVDAQQGAEEE